MSFVSSTKLVGITGGIGSGKTTIARFIQQLGYPVYFTDNEAKRLIQTDYTLRTAICDLLGDEVFANGEYRVDLVASKVFADKHLLQCLDNLVHPVVRNDLIEWSRRQEQELCFVESALLYKSGLDQLCDRIIVVDASEQVRIERVRQRDKMSAEQVRLRIAAQPTIPHSSKNIYVQNEIDITSDQRLKTEIENLCRNLILAH